MFIRKTNNKCLLYFNSFVLLKKFRKYVKEITLLDK